MFKSKLKLPLQLLLTPQILSLVSLGVSLMLLLYVVFLKDSPVYYVDNVRLFNEFKLSKDIKKEYQIKIDKQTQLVTSLVSKFENIEARKGSVAELIYLKEKIAIEDENLTKLQTYYSSHMTQKVWDRLNKYVKEYSESTDIKILVGGQGTGNVMFVDESIDITNDLLTYVNENYEGK